MGLQVHEITARGALDLLKWDFAPSLPPSPGQLAAEGELTDVDELEAEVRELGLLQKLCR